MEFIEHIKMIIFIETITLIVCGLAHVSCIFVGQEFNIITYPVMVALILFCCLLVSLVFMPLFEWLFDL